MIVLDCSAAVAISQGLDVGMALKSLICRGEKVIAPGLFRSEVANTAFRRIVQQGVPENIVFDELEDALSLVDEFVGEEDLVLEVVSESVRLKHPAYDLFYLVLARRKRATFATLDRRLMKLCSENGVNCIELIPIDVDEELWEATS